MNIKKILNEMRPCFNAPIDKKCDVCGGKAVLDAPSVHGPWGYFCVGCIPDYYKKGWEKIGYKLIVEKL